MPVCEGCERGVIIREVEAVSLTAAADIEGISEVFTGAYESVISPKGGLVREEDIPGFDSHEIDTVTAKISMVLENTPLGDLLDQNLLTAKTSYECAKCRMLGLCAISGPRQGHF